MTSQPFRRIEIFDDLLFPPIKTVTRDASLLLSGSLIDKRGRMYGGLSFVKNISNNSVAYLQPHSNVGSLEFLMTDVTPSPGKHRLVQST